MEKTVTHSITETIAIAMEQADRIKNIVIIYETKDEEKTSHGIIAPSDSTLAQLNFLCDIGKDWIFSQQSWC